MNIINQDREFVYIYEHKHENILSTEPVIYDGLLYGFNLMLNGVMLGTFDTLQESINEIQKIQQCKEEYYYVSRL